MNSSPYKKERLEELLQHLAAEFLEKESGPQSLITVTRVEYDKKKKKALIFISVLPEEKQKAAFDFVSRKKREFVEYLKSHSRMKMIPFISFAPDLK
jgi:ribosome-binding factor A